MNINKEQIEYIAKKLKMEAKVWLAEFAESRVEEWLDSIRHEEELDECMADITEFAPEWYNENVAYECGYYNGYLQARNDIIEYLEKQLKDEH